MHLRTILLCAWVLWTYGTGEVGLLLPRYEPIGAYETRPACEQARVSTRLPPGYSRLLCLPDTVNPNK